MDKNSFSSNQQKSCCEKLFVAIRNPSPFIRTIRFTSAANATTPSTPRDRCVRVSNVDSVSIETPPKNLLAAAAANSKKQAEKVALIQGHKGNHSHVSSPTINQARPKATILPVHSHENGIPAIPHSGAKSKIAESINDMSSAYIEHAGRKIRSPSNVGVRKPSITRDSFNDRINDFISRTKNKFHSAPSFIEVSGGKEKKLK